MSDQGSAIRVTRREFVTMLSAAMALPQLPRIERRGPAQRILVLGGGLAGLCSAYELQNLGHTVTVLEASTRPGGRVRTLREAFPPGLYVEAGAEQIPGVHQITQSYARDFGLSLVPNQVPGMRSFYFVRGQRVLPGDSAVWPFELTAEERTAGLSALFRKYVDGAYQEARAAGYTADPVRAMAAWDALKPGEWLRARGASPAAAELMTLGFGTEFGSAASFLLHNFNSRGGSFSYRIEGGNDRLPAEFARRVAVRYGTPVVSVTQDDTGVDVIVGNNETLRADRVICALPCPVIGRMLDAARLSAAKQRAIREQHYSHTVKVFLQSRTRFWFGAGHSGHVTTDLPIERLTTDPGADPGARGALTAYPIGDYARALEKMSESGRLSAALAQARQIFPELEKTFEGGVSHAWGAEPWQRGAFALHTPGQIGFISELAKPEGRVHFAGEHTSPWTGWMQGALESARRAAAEISGSLIPDR